MSQGYFFFRLFHSSFQDIKSLNDCGPDVPQVLLAVNSTCVKVVIFKIITSPNPTNQLSRGMAPDHNPIKITSPVRWIFKKKRLHVTVPHWLSKAIPCILFPFVIKYMWRSVCRSGCDLVNRMPPLWGFFSLVLKSPLAATGDSVRISHCLHHRNCPHL